MPARKIYAVMRAYRDGTCGWAQQWQASGTRTTDYQAAVDMAARLEAKPRNRMLGWTFYVARIA